MTDRLWSCCPPSTSPTARPCGWCRARPAARRTTATRSAAALAWQEAGAEWIHLVDLDAAFGRGSNREQLADVVGRLDVAVELSGGIRDDASLEAALATGCRRVNLGTAALEDPDWTASVIARLGDAVAVGLDVRGTTLAARGWTSEGGDLWATLDRLDAAGCARYVVTDVTKDGTLRGPEPRPAATRFAPARRRRSSPPVASPAWPTWRRCATWSATASRAPSSARRSTRARSPCRRRSTSPAGLDRRARLRLTGGLRSRTTVSGCGQGTPAVRRGRGVSCRPAPYAQDDGRADADLLAALDRLGGDPRSEVEPWSRRWPTARLFVAVVAVSRRGGADGRDHGGRGRRSSGVAGLQHGRVPCPLAARGPAGAGLRSAGRPLGRRRGLRPARPRPGRTGPLPGPAPGRLGARSRRTVDSVVRRPALADEIAAICGQEGMLSATEPGTGAELRVVLGPPEGLTGPALVERVERVGHRLATSQRFADSVDSLELSVVPA